MSKSTENTLCQICSMQRGHVFASSTRCVTQKMGPGALALLPVPTLPRLGHRCYSSCPVQGLPKIHNPSTASLQACSDRAHINTTLQA